VFRAYISSVSRPLISVGDRYIVLRVRSNTGCQIGTDSRNLVAVVDSLLLGFRQRVGQANPVPKNAHKERP
jgi:hypothetical protein